MSMTQIAVDDTTLASLDAAAALRSLSREEMLREAVQNLSDYDQWFQDMVQAGKAAVANGDVFSQEDIEAEDILLRQQLLQRG